MQIKRVTGVFFTANYLNLLVWHTMKTWRKDGVLVSAKTYDDVYKFGRFKEAFDFAKNLITGAGTVPVYDAQVKRVCRARGEAFYLSGN